MGKHFDQDYKDYVSKLVVEEKRSIKDVSYELDIPYGTMRRWVKDYRIRLDVGDSQGKYITPSEHKKELIQKEKEIARLREENEILKKAMHIFTQDPK